MPPFLLIDAGNTRLKWATASPEGKLQPAGHAPASSLTAASIKALAEKYPSPSVILACVVPRQLPWFRRAFGPRLHVLTGASPTLPFRFHYPKPAELGADRIAAAVAAQAEGRGPVIVISAGTATAFTVLDEQGRFCGGVIAPGLQPQLASLIKATGQLPETTLRPPRRLPARSTQEAIRAGVFLNFLGGVQEIVSQLTAALPPSPPPRLLLTGGHAPLLQSRLGPQVEVRPLLVFEGLHIMARRIFTASSDDVRS